VCGLLTLGAAILTVIFSAICGATLAFHSRPTSLYGVALAALFVPFAIGGSVWAYSASHLALWCGLQSVLVSSGTFIRAGTLLLLCLARILPLGVFFCATVLQRYTSDIRPYIKVHKLTLPFFLLSALHRIPKSILMLLGLFGGAMIASETSLSIFLYRANPGTEPETVNVVLSRLFREIYATAGPASLPELARFGMILCLFLLGGALVGSWIGRGALAFVRSILRNSTHATGTASVSITILSHCVTVLVLLPGFLAPIALFAHQAKFDVNRAITRIGDYSAIVALGTLVAVTITNVGIATAIRLRYSRTDFLSVLERSSLAASILLLPTFIPTLSIVAVLGWISNGHMNGLPGYLTLYISQALFHFPIFQFICMTLVATIPERHVAWQRMMNMRYSFSLVTDGFKRHATVIVALIGLGTVQIVTDGSISRWFSHLVQAPEEALYAAIFGRLSSASEAVAIAWSVGIVAILISGVLAGTYVRDLKNRPTYA
jgi:hypothetical protein